MSDVAATPASLPLLGHELPVDLELTGRVAQAPPAIAPACAHTRQAIKRGDVFVVCHTDGQIHPGCECGQGVYHRDTRFLSGLVLRLGGKAPIVLASTAEHNFFSRAEAMNDAWTPEGGPEVRRETMHVARTRAVEEGPTGAVVRERIEVTNYNAFTVAGPIAVELRADFKDLFEVRGFFGRARSGTFLRPIAAPDGVELLYQGADGRTRHSVVRADQAPARVAPGSWPDTHETGAVLAWDLALPARGGTWAVELTIAPTLDRDAAASLPPPAGPLDAARLEALHAAQDQGRTRITSENEGFAAFVGRGVADLVMLGTTTPFGPYPTAGIPWYACPFGRDGLIAALQSLPLGPEWAEATLRYLAHHQGRAADAYRDEEPGKILHELRLGELAALGEVPHSPYYGTIDATPLWLVLLHETWRWTGRDELVVAMWPHVLRALAWLDEHADADGDGFVEYARKGEKGLANQGWKDSHDSVPHPDGTLAAAPIALAEVQGYVYDARRRTAELARRMGDPALAERLEAEAARLKRAFNEAYWCEADGFYAIALDGAKRPVRAKASNPGQALWSGIIDEARVPGLVASMLAPDMFSGWGIRTMSSDAPAYNPLSYHNGTVWPHDAAMVAKGMADHGYKAEANQVLTGLYDVARHYPYQRLPELFGGFPRAGRFAAPVPYPVACSPQAWAAGTPLLLLAGALGLEPRAAEGVLRLNRPTLPPWLDHVALHGLRVGTATVDLAFRRVAGATTVVVTGQAGDMRVEVVGAP